MAIHYATEPANGSTLVRSGLEKASTRPSPLTGQTVDAKAADAKTLELSEPHRVYDLRADLIASGKGLESATHTGYRYLVTRAGKHLAGAEVHVDATGAAKLLANINYGPYVQATADAIEKAGALPDVAKGNYEARVLRFAAIGVMALWLKPDAGGADILYPLAPTPAGIDAEKPYSEAEFLAAIRPLAERRATKKDPASVP
jgi:hypothetical protein